MKECERTHKFQSFGIWWLGGWSNAVTTIHSLWQLKESHCVMVKLAWLASLTHIGPFSNAGSAVLLGALTASLTYLDHFPFGCLVVRFHSCGHGQLGFSRLPLGYSPPLARDRMRIHPHDFATANISQFVYLISLTSPS